MTDSRPALALHSYSCRLAFVHDPTYDVFAFLKDAATRGFDGVNLSLSGPDNDRLPPYRHLGADTDAHLAAVARALDRHGLSIELDTDTVEPARLGQALTIARRLGARVLRTFTHHPWSADLVRRTIRDLRAALPAAHHAGVTVALENHEEFTATELVEIVAAIDDPRLRLLFDYGNGIPVLEDPRRTLELMAPWIAACHVKDVVMVPATETPERVSAAAGVALGDGAIDLDRLTRGVRDAGLHRLCLQNVWGYHVPIGKLRPVPADDPRLGQSPFTWAPLPLDQNLVALDPESTLTPQQLIHAERHALNRAVARLRRMTS